MSILENNPPPLIGGSSPHITAKIDWLALTFKSPNGNRYPSKLTREYIETRPIRGYDIAIGFLDGRREYSHSFRSDMGTHIVYSGSCLNMVFDRSDISGIELVRWYEQMPCKVSRIDVAVDLHNTGIDLRGLYDEWNSNKTASKARTASLIVSSGENHGITVYVGNRQSEAFLRVYDKAAEQGIEADWIRCEVEYKSTKARQVTTALANSENWRDEIISRIRGQCDWKENEKWLSIMQSQPTETPRSKDTDTDTKAWLLNTCAKALARVAATDEPQILEGFLKQYRAELETYKSQVKQSDNTPIQ
jgi:hypothetical protein